MGLLDWLKEAAEQSQDAERRRLEARHRNDPAKLQRALARHDALNNTSNVNPYEEPEPDLDAMTEDEIELLRLQTEDEIESLQGSHQRGTSLISHLGTKAGPNTEAFAGLMGQLTSAISDSAIREKKRLLHKILLKQKRNALPPVQLSPAQLTAQKVAQQVSQMNETVTLLEQQCEAEVKQFPSREQAIRLRYRKAIDAILDQP